VHLALIAERGRALERRQSVDPFGLELQGADIGQACGHAQDRTDQIIGREQAHKADDVGIGVVDVVAGMAPREFVEVKAIAATNLGRPGCDRAALFGGLKSMGLGASRWKILARIHFQPDIAMSQLATQTTLSPSALTRAIDTLEQAQLVERTVDRIDKRVVRLNLSAAGEAAYGTAAALVEAQNGAIMDGVSPDEQVRLVKSMTRMRANLLSS